MVPLLDFYFHEDVRKAAVASLPDILRAGKAAMEKNKMTPQVPNILNLNFGNLAPKHYTSDPTAKSFTLNPNPTPYTLNPKP